MKNQVEFQVSGRLALFTDPITKVGGEKTSYRIPTYEAVKGIVKSIIWKPTYIWVIDELRVMNRIQVQPKGVKPVEYAKGGNSISIYTYLVDVCYQVRAHFEWNLFREDMASDRIDGKHFQIAQRMIQKGGRQDVFLGVRECQGYVEPCQFGEGKGYYDNSGEMAYDLMFHGFDYPDETGINKLYARFWNPVMTDGLIHYLNPEKCLQRKYVRDMIPNPPKSSGIREEALQNELVG